MAMKLASYAFIRGTGKYDWDIWLNGDIWQLEPGEDFTCKPNGLKQQCYGKASKRGLKVRVAVEDDGAVVVQAYKP
jgi:hypothetical protein